MPRVLKVGVCRVCSVEYALRDRRYKLTCSSICALHQGILNQLGIARLQGVSKQDINDMLLYFTELVRGLPFD